MEYAYPRHIFLKRIEKNFRQKFGQSYCNYLSCILFDFLGMSLFNLAALRLLSEFAEIYDFCAGAYFDSVSNICPDFLIGMPFGSIGVSNNLHRIGFVNSAGEAPLLLSKSVDKSNDRVMILKFKTFGIPLSEWTDNQDRIESALNIHIDEMREGDDCRIVIIRCVDGENRLSDYIEWSENLLSDENFEIVLGEGYSGRVSVNIAKIPHMLIGGSTGSGKSVLLKLVLTQCVKRMQKSILPISKAV